MRPQLQSNIVRNILDTINIHTSNKLLLRFVGIDASRTDNWASLVQNLILLSSFSPEIHRSLLIRCWLLHPGNPSQGLHLNRLRQGFQFSLILINRSRDDWDEFVTRFVGCNDTLAVTQLIIFRYPIDICAVICCINTTQE